MSRQLEDAQAQLQRANRMVRVTKIVCVVYLLVVGTVLAVQQFGILQGQAEQAKVARDALQESLDDNQAQHAKTQEFVKCIANALLMPVAQRSAAIFDQCGIDAEATRESAASVSAVVPAEPSTEQTSPQPTTSSPPDPEPSRPVAQPQPERNVLDQVIDVLLSPLELLNQGGGDR